MDHDKEEKYIWYNKLKWDKKLPFNGDTTIQLSLSNGEDIKFKVDTLEKLQSFVNKLERSL